MKSKWKYISHYCLEPEWENNNDNDTFNICFPRFSFASRRCNSRPLWFHGFASDVARSDGVKKKNTQREKYIPIRNDRYVFLLLSSPRIRTVKLQIIKFFPFQVMNISHCNCLPSRIARVECWEYQSEKVEKRTEFRDGRIVDSMLKQWVSETMVCVVRWSVQLLVFIST